MDAPVKTKIVAIPSSLIGHLYEAIEAKRDKHVDNLPFANADDYEGELDAKLSCERLLELLGNSDNLYVVRPE